MHKLWHNIVEFLLIKFLTDKTDKMAANNKIKITQIRSKIGSPERQKRTLIALGLRKMHNPVEVDATPQVLGMVRKVRHLVSVEEVK